MKSALTALVCVVIASQLHAQPAVTADPANNSCLRLGADESLEQFYPLFDKLIEGVYERAGFCATSVPLSPKRIEQMMDAGTLDGDWIRVEGYAEEFGQDLIPVPYPLFQVEAVLLSPVNSGFDGSVEDLRGRSVGYQSGFRWIEKNLPLAGALPMQMPSGLPIRDLLERGRFEVFATDGVRAAMILKNSDQTPSKLRVHSWRKISFYHMVHRRHADKIEAIGQALTESMALGEFDPIFALPGLSRIEHRD